MNYNRIIIYLTIILVMGAILLSSGYKVYQIHNERVKLVTEKLIIDTAKKCYYNASCVEDNITLEELYNKMGLANQTNPLTKKVYNPKSYVSIKDNFNFVEII